MANHPSAQKRNRQRVVRTERNRAAKSSVRSAVKKARSAIATGDKAAAKATVATASTALAKAAKKGVLHKNAASRVTSRIQSALAKLG
ncbi:MAG: 30S ribosomal protein S20 [Polyangiaceae bacterium]|nr:30S ribosomal protein S20 [Polyangiaceae bacterium]